MYLGKGLVRFQDISFKYKKCWDACSVMFMVHQTSSLRWPIWDWSSPGIYPSSTNPWTHPLHPKQGVTFSVASVMVQMLLFAAAVTPRTKRSLHPGKPQQPTSIGSTEPTCPCLCTAPQTPDILQVSPHRVPPCGLLMTESVPKWLPVWWNLRRQSSLGAVLCGCCDQVFGLPLAASLGLWRVGLVLCQVWS